MSFGKVFQFPGVAISKALFPSVFFNLAILSSSNNSLSDLRFYLAVLLTIIFIRSLRYSGALPS